MERFKYKIFVPPGGRWFYEVPETKVFLSSNDSEGDLLWHVRQHYLANKLPVPDNLQAVVQNYMCLHLPEGFCEGELEPLAKRAAPLTFFSIVQFTQALVHKLTKADFFVSQEEAERRARICLRCPENSKNLCTTCNGLRSLAAALIGNRQATSVDAKLEACAVCGCALRAKLHVNRAYIAESAKRLKEYPPYCWMVTNEPTP